MGALFGKTKRPRSRVTLQDKAVLQLKQQRDKIKQYQTKVEFKLEKDKELARKLLKDGKRDRAKLLLKKKRYQEQVLIKSGLQLEQLEQMVQELEFAMVEITVIDGLKAGNEALKKLHAVLNVEDIERILDETQEGIEKQRELDELLSGAMTQEDDEAVLEELDEIIKESIPAITPEVDKFDDELKFPEIPVNELGRETAVKKVKREKVMAS